MHLGPPKKYIHHIKKDKLFVCSVCGKEYKQSFNLKLHYGRDHTKAELEQRKVPLAPIIHYSRRQVETTKEKQGIIKQIEQEKREAFVLLEEETRDEVLRL